MTYPHHSMSHPTDPHPVRPGTSAALTARTIDATIHPPLVRAQETVVALVPRLTAPLGSPLFLTMLAGTLVLVLVARRAKLRAAGILLSVALFVTLTSFRPVESDGELPTAPVASPFVVEVPQAPEPPPRVDVEVRPRRWERGLGPELIASLPEITIVTELSPEMFVHDEKLLRAYVKELRHRLRAEARRKVRNWKSIERSYSLDR
jgi:hypothetical protein